MPWHVSTKKIMLKIRNFLIYSLFFIPTLIFLVNTTRNPFYIQEVVLIITVTLITISFTKVKEFKLKKFIFPEKILFAFWGIVFYQKDDFEILALC